eukprot:m.11151 g.11151  ORF g.11151 m.11151 type:complete len:174 (+) comp23027_c0_seq2:360-881(+)
MSELPSSPEECLKKLNRIKTVKSKSYTFARVASQFFHEVEEAKEADRCLSRCQKAIKDLKSEKERYEKMLQEINADISSMEESTKSVERYKHEKKTWAISFLVGKYSQSKSELDASRCIVGLNPLESSWQEEQAKVWNGEQQSEMLGRFIASTKRQRHCEEGSTSTAKTSRTA